jgi:D-alanine-D-alanine ligase
MSSEREVSLASGKACAKALEEAGYEVVTIDVGTDVAEKLSAIKPDACFNALHGRWGEDGCIQGLLEMLQIPYTHSGVLASTLAMHKDIAKTVFRSAGIPVARSTVAPIRQVVASHVMEPPYVVKPVADGSSVGIHVVPASAPPPDIDDTYGNVMVERFVPGRELTCAVLGDRALGVTEIFPAEGFEFYDYSSKYASGGSRHVVPAQLSREIYEKVLDLSLRAHDALGCRGISRADFRYDEDGTGELVCLEINTQPGMTTTSLAPELAAYADMEFAELVSWIIEDASCDR